MKPFLLFLCLYLTVMLQAQVSKTVNVTAGGLATKLTSTEKTTVTNLTLNGTIDARDFKTMRDDMPALEVIDMSGATIAAFDDFTSYTNALGTSSPHTAYKANAIPQNAFYNLYSHASKEGLTSFTFPSTITAIGESAFEGCEDLNFSAFPNTLITIGENAFAYCDGFVTITIPSSVTIIEEGAFKGCDGITSIVFPSSPLHLDDYVFAYCDALASVSIPPLVTFTMNTFYECPCKITLEGDNANFVTEDGVLFNKTKSVLIKCPVTKTGSYTIPSTVDTISAGAFRECNKIASVIIPNSVTIIEDEAFYGCESMITVLIPSSVKSIGSEAFSECFSITSVEIPSTVTTLEYGVFSGCTSLTSVLFSTPSSLSIIDESAFEGCSSLKSVVIPSSVKEINDYAFAGCIKLDSITIPSSVTYIGQAVLEECPCTILLDENNTNFIVVDNVLFNKEQTELISCSAKNAGDYSIPPTVIYINTAAFCGCTQLTSVTIPASLKDMGYRVFQHCNGLKTIFAYPKIPVDISEVYNVFDGVDFSKCILYVPSGATNAYQIADQWSNFKNIVEMESLLLSATTVTLASTEGSTALVTISSSTSWEVSSDQTWLTVNPALGTGNGTLTFTATANPTKNTRTATISVSATGVSTQTIVVTQEAGSGNGLSSIAEGLITLYPNPVTEEFRIYGLKGMATLTISDMNGKVQFTKEINGREYINVDILPKGVYLVRIGNNGCILIKKLIKK